MFKDVQNIGSKIESLSGNMLLLQNSQTGGGRGSFIDFSKYIDQQKLTDALKPIIKEIEKHKMRENRRNKSVIFNKDKNDLIVKDQLLEELNGLYKEQKNMFLNSLKCNFSIVSNGSLSRYSKRNK